MVAGAVADTDAIHLIAPDMYVDCDVTWSTVQSS